MAITSKEEFKKVVPVNSSFTDDASIDTFIDQAEEKYLLPLIGRAFYDELTTIDSPSAQQLKVLIPIYRAVSYTALMLYIPFGQVQVSSEGVQIISTNDRKSAFDWQVAKLEASTGKLGLDGFELVLERLEENINDWETYKNSDARKANTSYFLNTAAAFNEVYNIDRSRVTFLCLWPLITEIEENVVWPALGAYADTLIAAIKAGQLTPTQKLHVKAIRRAIAYAVIQDAIPTLSVEVSAMGLSVNMLTQFKSVNASSPAPDNRIESLLSLVKEKSKEYLQVLPTLVPGYVPPASAIYNIDNGDNSIVSLF